MGVSTGSGLKECPDPSDGHTVVYMFPQTPRHTCGRMHEHVHPHALKLHCPDGSAHRQAPPRWTPQPTCRRASLGSTQMHVQLSLTPSHPHGAMCPLEHMHTWSLCTRGSAAGVAGKRWKVDSCSDDTGTSQLPTRISKSRETLHHTCSWAVGVIPGLRAAAADFSSSQQVPGIACDTRGPGERKSQSP